MTITLISSTESKGSTRLHPEVILLSKVTVVSLKVTVSLYLLAEGGTGFTRRFPFSSPIAFDKQLEEVKTTEPKLLHGSDGCVNLRMHVHTLVMLSYMHALLLA
jgi:hypothetical protein